MKISAIVSVYNSERFIRGCIEDLLQQTIVEDIEIVVVNTGSTQKERKIVREYKKKHPNIKYIETKNRKTVYAAWNIGIKNSKGTYLTSANTDDRHREDALEIMVNYLGKNEHIDMVYPSYLVWDDCDEIGDFKEVKMIKRVPYCFKRIAFNCLPGPQPMWRRRLHDKFGYFDERLKVAGDHDFWLRFANINNIKHIDELIGYQQIRGDSIEHGNQLVSSYESGYVTEKFLENNYPKGTQNEKWLRKKLSVKAYWRANTYVKYGLTKMAFRELKKSLQYDVTNFESMKLFLKTMLNATKFILTVSCGFMTSWI